MNLIIKITSSFENKNILEFGDKSVCVYWDFKGNKWSDMGCEINELLSTRYITVCECSHLSYFGVKVDKKERENPTTMFIVNYIFTSFALIDLLIITPVLYANYPKKDDGSVKSNKDERKLERKRLKRRFFFMLNIIVCYVVVNIILVFHKFKKENKVDKTKPNKTKLEEIVSYFYNRKLKI